MTQLSNRLNQAMSAAGLTLSDLKRVTGISYQALQKASLGQTKELKWSSGELIAKALGVSQRWLATGKGDMLVSSGQANDTLIPQYDARGSMGSGLLLRDQSGVIRNLNVSADWLRNNVKSCTAVENLCVVTGFGDSMRPMFNSGDPLLLDSGVKSVEFDAIYFFRVGDEGFIKRLQRIPGDGIRAISENKGYESWTIKPDMDFEVFGRVVKVWCSEDF